MIVGVAAARKLLSLVLYGLRDGEIHGLTDKEASRAPFGHSHGANSKNAWPHLAI
jgi:hypothetical protein